MGAAQILAGLWAAHVVLSPRVWRARQVTPRKADGQLRCGGTGSLRPSCGLGAGHQGLPEVGPTCPPPLGVSVRVRESSLPDGRGPLPAQALPYFKTELVRASSFSFPAVGASV